ncbi:MAG: rod shape-determining protein MreD [Spirochaetes bacterium GWD1_27_9]|nr:MAG: rod shape-determining protein MreD [Spirochaetes bacterium GWB1_27_13]OHD23113.1 MAG: rod shape-determining protein MreD [Spirochaetes bacterium GWC1_27_15]OHD39925.1 MAG: rod shape-determining protein MreD [Spirochaetes bacterium GWD1_27_9]
MIKKVIINFLIIAAIIALSYTKLINFIGIYNVIPDILLILVVFNGLFFGSMFGMVFGFCAGLAYDFSTYPLIGFYALIYLIIGVSTSVPEKKIDIEHFFVTVVLLFIFFILKALLFLVIGSIFLKPQEIYYYFKDVFVIQLLYTIGLSFPIFLIYKKIASINRKTEKR